MKELIQNKEWFEKHNNGVAWYATHKAIKNNKNKRDCTIERYFIGTTKEIESHLGNEWVVFPI